MVLGCASLFNQASITLMSVGDFLFVQYFTLLQNMYQLCSIPTRTALTCNLWWSIQNYIFPSLYLLMSCDQLFYSKNNKCCIHTTTRLYIFRKSRDAAAKENRVSQILWFCWSGRRLSTVHFGRIYGSALWKQKIRTFVVTWEILLVRKCHHYSIMGLDCVSQ
jgi:hypothetical protein